LMPNIAVTNRGEHHAFGRVNLLAEEGYNLLKLAAKVGALQ
jgi:hypothetical protein